MSGRVSEGLDVLRRSVEIFPPTAVGYSVALVHFGRAYLRAGRFEEALSWAKRAAAVARDRDERGNAAWADHLLGDVASRMGAGEEAEAHYDRAMSVARDLGMRPLRAWCHRGLGMLFAGSGHRDESRQHLAAAAAIFREMSMPPGS